MFHSYHVPLIISCTVLWIMNDAKAAVTGPQVVDTPIRLAKAKDASTLTTATPLLPTGGNIRATHDLAPNSVSTNRPKVDGGSDTNTERASMKKQDRVVIIEPPNGSLLEGNKFVVVLKIESANETQFRQSYVDNNEGRICLSLDRSPFVCWPPYGKMLFTQATEGEHEIVGMLWRNGILEEFSTSEKVTFTTVYNPKILQDEEPDKIKQDNLGPKTDIMVHDNVAFKTTKNSETGATVQVPFPIIQITSPMSKVSYTGTSVPFQSVLPILNDYDETFEKHFQSAFVCVNLDIATAFSCFPIFGSNPIRNSTSSTSSAAVVPWLVGLNKGMHTIEAKMTHPETADVLDDSSSGTHTFFMAGDNNEGAAFTGSINIRGQQYVIPIMRGGCLEAQTRSFCNQIGLQEMRACTDPVLNHLKEIALQTGFVSVPC